MGRIGIKLPPGKDRYHPKLMAPSPAMNFPLVWWRHLRWSLTLHGWPCSLTHVWPDVADMLIIIPPDCKTRLSFLCHQCGQSQKNYKKKVYQRNAQTDEGQTILKEYCTILVIWVSMNLLDTQHTWIILKDNLLTGSKFVLINIAMCHCCDLATLAQEPNLITSN